MEKMYSMNDTLNRGSKMSSPKRENMFNSVFSALNLIWDRVTKVHASFMAGINYPLSVTVVHNEGIIPHEFFKDLTTKRDGLSTDNVYIHNTSMKESLNIMQNLHHSILEDQELYMGDVFNENTMENFKFNCNYINISNKTIEKDPVVKENLNHLSPIETSNKESIQGLFEHIYLDSTENMNNVHNYEYTNGMSIPNKKQSSDCIENNVSDKIIADKEQFLSTTRADLENEQEIKQTSVRNVLANVWQVVYGNMADRFNRTDSLQIDTLTKRSLSPKQRRKHNIIAKGRGRGRARSQLRRSGVSQTWHRKERTKHDLAADIQNDFENWQEEDYYSLEDDVVDGLDTSITVNSHEAFTFADVEQKLQKPKSHKTYNHGVPKLSVRMRCIPEYIDFCKEDYIEDEYHWHRSTFRPRLVSESSVDSEDSCGIVFETESEITWRSNIEDTDDSDTDQTSDDDEDEDEDQTLNLKKLISPVQKVKFNLNPIVHVMVQWDYAYRAARKGPWEEMARDRVRFKGRINCIGRVLNPILSTQHRLRIWQERFALVD
ncbi:protein phosphatase 1 regulatory subunit 15 [Megalopta genalis]|uniref:protein phosphatase 1 regulatory subunit 15 n=1 Tax=Megalopta genalis TaxID=115081 RepID=UPI003FD33A26